MKSPHRFLKLPLPPPVVSSNENNEKFNPLTARRSEFVSDWLKSQVMIETSLLEFYLAYNRFCLKRLRSKLQKLRVAIVKQFWL